MNHASFDAKVAWALLQAGRRVVSKHGTTWFVRGEPDFCHGEAPQESWAPYTLADPAPLTAEQAVAAAKAGACVRYGEGWSMPVRWAGGRFESFDGGCWAPRPILGDASAAGWFIVPDPSTEPEAEPEPQKLRVKQAMTSKDRQEGGTHYLQFKIQPIEFIVQNELGYREGNVVKYISRHRLKGQSLSDLKKARHYIDMLIEEAEHEEV